MPPFQQHSRINVQDLKAQMVTRVGPERANQYFNHFKGFISLRFSKTELDKLVVLTIGKENIGLHNEIIKAILTNAMESETPPPRPPLVQDTSKPVKGVRRKPLLQFAIVNDASKISPAAGDAPVWSNGVICGESPKTERDKTMKKDKERLSSTHIDGANCVIDTHRPSDHIQGAAEQSKASLSDGSMHLRKRPRIIIPSSPDLGISKTVGDALSLWWGVADSRRGEVHRQWESELVRTSLGTPYNNMGSATKQPQFRLAGLSYLQLKDAEQDFDHSSNLPSADLVQGQMERIAELEGLEGVGERCVEILNQGIDAFLKGLIGSCIDFVKSRSLPPHRGSQSERQGSSHACSGGGAQKESMQEDLSRATISFLDFKAAMDANPPQLGHNWPFLLERLHLYSLD